MTKPVLGKTAVYRLYDSDGTLLYVGLGSDPESRWKDHAREKSWWPEVSSKTVTWHDSLGEASQAEHEAMHSEDPVHNKAKWQWSRQGEGQGAPTDITTVPLGIFRQNIPDRVEAAHFRNEATVVTKNGEPRAALVPYSWLKDLISQKGQAEEPPQT
ncbi:GIY-YIG nuclease family protein [Marinitenerispora sediminis]|uniref:GIY-YIG domain-containing protein n=1 Tax=Marinitenerispora sediminis TaxID=1931232 RepID=A0A368T6Y4_9ACTN|nr:GIY-YIG nuclease family protein [Marinitenerispora sediminis]RCV49728.1 hypothetical protein DEF23_23250 [Marinitenerispora sediminis]RCV59275.1 hypothetical protein DEF24_09895 [Marinitenerispora sediminis]